MIRAHRFGEPHGGGRWEQCPDRRSFARDLSARTFACRSEFVRRSANPSCGCGPRGAEYGPGEGGMGDHEFAGELAIAGSPFQVSVANVN